jgi:hypothetical protein
MLLKLRSALCEGTHMSKTQLNVSSCSWLRPCRVYLHMPPQRHSICHELRPTSVRICRLHFVCLQLSSMASKTPAFWCTMTSQLPLTALATMAHLLCLLVPTVRRHRLSTQQQELA